MCLLFLYINTDKSSKYKLIAINNRDEYYARPTLEAQLRPESVNLSPTIGAKDLERGGSWLSISKKDDIVKLGSLLNIVGSTCYSQFGRGSIVCDYVINPKTTIESYNDDLVTECNKFSAFNFVSLEMRESVSKLKVNCNTPKRLTNLFNGNSNERQSQCFAFGNTPYESPLEKVKYGLKKFEQLVTEHENTDQELLLELLLNLLKDKTKCWPDEQLETRAPKWGNDLSSVFVEVSNAQYGTRTHTVILMDHSHNIDYFEQTMNTTDTNWTMTHVTL